MPSQRYFYLLRHGQTEFNARGCVQGEGINAPLNITGQAQAEAFWEAYKDHPFDVVHTSNLLRAQQTVKPFIQKPLPWFRHRGLNEINWGKQEGIKINDQADNTYLEMVEAWRSGQTDYKIEGGESPEDVAERQRPLIPRLLEREQDQHMLICMHGRAMRIFLCLLLELELRQMDDFQHSNLGLHLLSYDGGRFQIERENDTRHLERLSNPKKSPSP